MKGLSTIQLNYLIHLPQFRATTHTNWLICLQATLFSAISYRRYSTDDAIYDLGGSVVRPNGGSDAGFTGLAWESMVVYRFSRTLEGLISYSQFHAGDFIKETGPDKTTRFVGFELLFKF